MDAFGGSMSKTLKLEAKTPKKKLPKKTMTKTRKNETCILEEKKFLKHRIYKIPILSVWALSWPYHSKKEAILLMK